MENEKKPSRLGMRLSAIVVAVLLVVCMAVPVFAITVQPNEYNNLPFALELPEGYAYYVFVPRSNNECYLVFAFNELVPGEPHLEETSNTVTIRFGTDYLFCILELDGTLLEDWKAGSSTGVFWLPRDSSLYRSNVIIYSSSGDIFFEPVFPPPPDPMESVGSGLTVVLDWVGSVVSAVVSGPMSGLLILLAVPVAITLLLVAFIVIRRIIWGA